MLQKNSFIHNKVPVLSVKINLFLYFVCFSNSDFYVKMLRLNLTYGCFDNLNSSLNKYKLLDDGIFPKSIYYFRTFSIILSLLKHDVSGTGSVSVIR
jgi:hypothetical protein